MNNKHINTNELRIREFKEIIKDLNKESKIYFRDYNNNIFPISSANCLRDADFENTNLISFGMGTNPFTVNEVIEFINTYDDIDDFEIHYRYSWGDTGNIITDIDIDDDRIYLIDNFMNN